MFYTLARSYSIIHQHSLKFFSAQGSNISAGGGDVCRWRSLTWRKGRRLTDGIIEDEDDIEAHSREESSYGETCVGPMILWMSMERTKTLINYQKRVSKTKRTDSEDVEALKACPKDTYHLNHLPCHCNSYRSQLPRHTPASTSSRTESIILRCSTSQTSHSQET
ncbi:hypothetical protein M405DRAFT_811537 [Rhizopogon salebrosus TDB-379]|nr:hypothetical protein M405DRAFT_811537 [Rhizopogon salebrosus TDB-379]